jgi:hypothetical protein
MGFLLSVVHLVYATITGLVIYLRPGDYSWVSIAWLPGGVLLYRFGSLLGSPMMAMGSYLLLGGSVLAGVIAMQAIRVSVLADGHGGYGWRLWVALLLWGVWVPMPYRGTIFYWFESY